MNYIVIEAYLQAWSDVKVAPSTAVCDYSETCL